MAIDSTAWGLTPLRTELSTGDWPPRMEVTPSPQPYDIDIEYLASGTLARRSNDADPAAAAASASRRQYVYQRNADYDSLIEACSRKLVAHPANVRALMIRANSYFKKGEAAGQFVGARPPPPLTACTCCLEHCLTCLPMPLVAVPQGYWRRPC